MSKYYLNLILLEGCPYSEAAFETVKNLNIKNKHIWVNGKNKENYKTKYISTFPQIYLKKENRLGSVLIGGNSDLQNIISTFYKKKLDNKLVKEFETKNNWSHKATLRIIQLINSIKN